MSFLHLRTSTRNRNVGKLVVVATLLLVLCGHAMAQEMGNFQKSRGYYPNPLAPYTPRQADPPTFSNSPRLDRLIRNGKVMLSLDDAIAIALENNLDLAIARYNLPIADTDVLRSLGGSTILGVNTGLVTGTPGGGAIQAPGASGAGAGGTTAGAGGTGAGAGGITESTLGSGPPIEQFDPALTGTLEIEHATTPESFTLLTGVPFLTDNTRTANFGYTQGFATGTDFSAVFDNSRTTSNSLYNVFNPLLNSSFRFQLRQHLLQGFGIKNQDRFITIARTNKKESELAFRAQVIYTVTQIENLYWNLVAATEDVKAKQRSLELSMTLASDNRKMVQTGSLAPIEIVHADSQVASSNQALIASKTNLQLQQFEMINAISRNISDEDSSTIEVLPTDTVELAPSDLENTPIAPLIALALAQRPEVEQQKLDLDNRDLSRKTARNELLPALDLAGFYGASSLGGPLNLANPVPAPGFTSSGYGDTFGRLFNSSGPDKGIFLTLNIPIRNRTAQATQARSELEYRQAQLLLQQFQNTIRTQVHNAAFTLQQDRAAYEAAVEARQYAQRSLDAEQEKYSLGASTSYNVLNMINGLATADSTLVQALAAYAEARVALDQVTGNTLKRYNISLDDAIEGEVRTLPVVPGVKPAPQGAAEQPTPQR